MDNPTQPMQTSNGYIRSVCVTLAGIGLGIGAIILYFAIEEHRAVNVKANQILTRKYLPNKRGVIPDSQALATQYRDNEMPAIFRYYLLGGALCTVGLGFAFLPTWVRRRCKLNRFENSKANNKKTSKFTTKSLLAFVTLVAIAFSIPLNILVILANVVFIYSAHDNSSFADLGLARTTISSTRIICRTKTGFRIHFYGVCFAICNGNCPQENNGQLF